MNKEQERKLDNVLRDANPVKDEVQVSNPEKDLELIRNTKKAVEDANLGQREGFFRRIFRRIKR